MESVLDELYYAAIEKEKNPFVCQEEEVNKKEGLIGEKLKKLLTKEQWAVFVEYLDLYADRRDVEMKNAYQCGFRQGLVLAVESFCKTNR